MKIPCQRDMRSIQTKYVSLSLIYSALSIFIFLIAGDDGTYIQRIRKIQRPTSHYGVSSLTKTAVDQRKAELLALKHSIPSDANPYAKAIAEMGSLVSTTSTGTNNKIMAVGLAQRPQTSNVTLRVGSQTSTKKFGNIHYQKNASSLKRIRRQPHGVGIKGVQPHSVRSRDQRIGMTVSTTVLGQQLPVRNVQTSSAK